ncbi:MAG TPA: polysaccharide deacetylase family protein [Solirubrobacteraceae bacterium]|jgi:peptidoglycan/xylan/chitin deacetylase (PgdA/CDA1 family)|nr:polysaccharide deacetylase family protein [Solirubrobacteraceae bacterium]
MITSPDRLAWHVEFLREAGHRFTGAAELADTWTGNQPPGGLAVLTFDDGWLDALTVAAPLLADRGVPGTFFLAPGLFGNREPRLGEAGQIVSGGQARELHAMGMELGCHSMYHPDLRTLGDRDLAEELARSRFEIEALSGERCRSFAYPSGWHDERVQAAVRAEGFDIAFAFGPQPWSRWAVPRLGGPPTAALESFPLYLRKGHDSCQSLGDRQPQA